MHETWHFYKFGDADFKDDNTFLTLQPKIPKESHFGPKIDFIFLLCTMFYIFANSRVLIPNITIVFFFDFLVQKHPKGYFSSKILKDFYFSLKLFQTYNSKLQKQGVFSSKIETFLGWITCLFTILRVLITNIRAFKSIKRFKEHFLFQI